MTSKEKIEYLWEELIESTRLRSDGFFYLKCYPTIDIEANNGIPDDAPIIFSTGDKVAILQKFEKDDLIIFLNYDEKNKTATGFITDMSLKEQDACPYSFSRSGSVLMKKPKIKTNLNLGILIIDGITVEISSKAGIENNPLRLLKTLAKEPDKVWYKDEIIEDWEGKVLDVATFKRIPRNRVYSSAKSLNNKIGQKTNLKDFILFDTHKFQINPKYVDILRQ